MSEFRPSRTAWPAMDSRAPTSRRRLAVGALYAAVVLNLVLSLLLFAYVIVLKDSRDTEQQRIKDQLQINNCALLDQLPRQAHALDRLRATYHCGPGL
jgi:hypothetical protein